MLKDVEIPEIFAKSPVIVQYNCVTLVHGHKPFIRHQRQHREAHAEVRRQQIHYRLLDLRTSKLRRKNVNLCHGLSTD